MASEGLLQQLEKMRADWDARARENALYYVATGRADWSEEEFFASGERAIAEVIRSDTQNICRGQNPETMRVVEIGCGAGRLTRPMADFFGEVHAVDISGEMVRRAKALLRDAPNAFVYQNNGKDLSVLPADLEFDFAFSFIVFQHLPSVEIIESYLREVHRVLKPGALFKFQVQGIDVAGREPDDTWLGVHVRDEDVDGLAERTGFEARFRWGAGTQDFWLWFFKKSEAT